MNGEICYFKVDNKIITSRIYDENYFIDLKTDEYHYIKSYEKYNIPCPGDIINGIKIKHIIMESNFIKYTIYNKQDYNLVVLGIDGYPNLWNTNMKYLQTILVLENTEEVNYYEYLTIKYTIKNDDIIEKYFNNGELCYVYNKKEFYLCKHIDLINYYNISNSNICFFELDNIYKIPNLGDDILYKDNKISKLKNIKIIINNDIIDINDKENFDLFILNKNSYINIYEKSNTSIILTLENGVIINCIEYIKNKFNNTFNNCELCYVYIYNKKDFYLCEYFDKYSFRILNTNEICFFEKDDIIYKIPNIGDNILYNNINSKLNCILLLNNKKTIYITNYNYHKYIYNLDTHPNFWRGINRNSFEIKLNLENGETINCEEYLKNKKY